MGQYISVSEKNADCSCIDGLSCREITSSYLKSLSVPQPF